MSEVFARMTTLEEVGGKDSVGAEADGGGFAIGTMSGVIARATTLKDVEGKDNAEAEVDGWGFAIRATEAVAGVVDDGMMAAPPERLCFFEGQMPL